MARYRSQCEVLVTTLRTNYDSPKHHLLRPAFHLLAAGGPGSAAHRLPAYYVRTSTYRTSKTLRPLCFPGHSGNFISSGGCRGSICKRVHTVSGGPCLPYFGDGNGEEVNKQTSQIPFLAELSAAGMFCFWPKATILIPASYAAVAFSTPPDRSSSPLSFPFCSGITFSNK